MHFIQVIRDLPWTRRDPTSSVTVLMIISTCSMSVGLKLHQVKEDFIPLAVHISANASIGGAKDKIWIKVLLEDAQTC